MSRTWASWDAESGSGFLEGTPSRSGGGGCDSAAIAAIGVPSTAHRRKRRALMERLIARLAEVEACVVMSGEELSQFVGGDEQD